MTEYVTQKQLQETFNLAYEKSAEYMNIKRGAFMAKSFIGDSGPMGLSNVTCESLDLITECNRSDDNQGCSESSVAPLTEATERPMHVDLNVKPRVWNGGSRESTSETTCTSETDPVIAVLRRSETTGLQPSGDNVGFARGACVPAAEVGEIDVINAFVGASGSETALPPHVEAHSGEVHRKPAERPASRVSDETAVSTTPTNVNMRVGTKTIADVLKASVPSAECKQLGNSDDGWTTVVRKKSVEFLAQWKPRYQIFFLKNISSIINVKIILTLKLYRK